MASTAAPGEPESATHTTKQREWWGWFGVMGWLFCMVNGYNELPNGYSDDNIFWCSMLFQILFAVSVIAVSFKFGSDPNGLGRLAHYATPVAIVLTAVFSVIPQPIGPILFVISPVFMAPATARRAYGILRSAAPGRTLFTYMSGVAAAFLLLHIVIDFYEMVLNYEAPTEIAFVVFSVLAFLAWLGVRRSIDITVYEQSPAKRRPSKSLLVGIAALLLAAFWLRQMNNFINYAIEQYDDYLYIPVYAILPPVIYMLYSEQDGDAGTTDAAAGALKETAVDAPLARELSEMQILLSAGLSLDEIKVAILIAQGESPRDVARTLHKSATDVTEIINTIRDKLEIPADPVITAIVAQYNLSKRESDMLRYLRQNKSNREITSELFLSEETVRIHIRNLLKKIPVENRNEVAAWMESFGLKPDYEPGTEV